MADEFVTVKITGLEELQQKLEEIPTKLAKRSLRKALRAGANVIRNAIVTLAPKDTGFLSRHFGTRISVMRDELAATAYVGPQGKIDYPLYSSGAYKIKRKHGKVHKVGRIAVASVARFLEFGTMKMGKKPFMTPAFEDKKSEAVDAITTELKEGLDDVS